MHGCNESFIICLLYVVCTIPAVSELECGSVCILGLQQIPLFSIWIFGCLNKQIPNYLLMQILPQVEVL